MCISVRLWRHILPSYNWGRNSREDFNNILKIKIQYWISVNKPINITDLNRRGQKEVKIKLKIKNKTMLIGMIFSWSKPLFSTISSQRKGTVKSLNSISLCFPTKTYRKKLSQSPRESNCYSSVMCAKKIFWPLK